jgi:hypothetical protein
MARYATCIYKLATYRVEVRPGMLVAVILWSITTARGRGKAKHGRIVAFWHRCRCGMQFCEL